MTYEKRTGLQNQLLVNPKLSDLELRVFENLQNHFEKEFGQDGFIFVPSSGSSSIPGDSAKLIAISRVAVANSAERFNSYFEATSLDSWGLVLPTFHVAGLSILARANLAKARVFSSDWVAKKMQTWLSQNKIAFLSLVPAQVFDLIQLKVKVNSHIKKVFVGGGALSESLRTEFLNLGWPLVETYGMTETCSMIAVKENSKLYKVLPQVEVYVEDSLLRINCNSSAHSSIQLKQGRIEITRFETGWVQTEDQVKLVKMGEQIYLEFLGRATDYVKILGEGVSMVELRGKLDKVCGEFSIPLLKKHLLTIDDNRLENRLVLAIDSAITTDLADRLVDRFNQVVRAYEKIHTIVNVDQIPLTDLGKVKANELKEIVLSNLERRSNDKKI